MKPLHSRSYVIQTNEISIKCCLSKSIIERCRLIKCLVPMVMVMVGSSAQLWSGDPVSGSQLHGGARCRHLWSHSAFTDKYWGHTRNCIIQSLTTNQWTSSSYSTSMPSAALNNMDIFSLVDTNNIRSEDVEKLKSLLPPEYQQSGKLTQLEIIIEAIHYIKDLKLQLHC